MKKAIWFSYDLGVNGDYEGLYAWLDNYQAIECGDSLAFFFYSPQKDLIDEIKKELQENVQLQRRDRIYVIWKEGAKVKGKFLFGTRKAAAWTGYAATKVTTEEEA